MKAAEPLIDEVVRSVEDRDRTFDVNESNKKSPPANNSKEKSHGGETHNEAINDRFDEAMNDPTVINVRKNQAQTDVDGNKVGNNKPDLQYDKYDVNTDTWNHYNIEWDNVPANSVNHGKTITKNDPKAKVELNILKTKK